LKVGYAVGRISIKEPDVRLFPAVYFTVIHELVGLLRDKHRESYIEIDGDVFTAELVLNWTRSNINEETE